MRDDAVGNQFEHLEGARVDDVISIYVDSCDVFVLLVGFELADNLDVGDFFAEVNGYIPVPHDMEGAGALDTLQWAIGSFDKALVDATKIF